MNIGSVICAKSIEHREVVEVKEGKHGRQQVRANRFGFKFQSEHNQLSTVGVFIYLGTFPEADGPEKIHQFAESQLRRLGWSTTEGEPHDG